MLKGRLLFIFVSLVFACRILPAQPVDILKAKKIAVNHLSAIKKGKLKSQEVTSPGFHFSLVATSVQNRDTLCYVLNDSVNNCFVIIAADQRVWPVLGYSTGGIYHRDNLPPAFKAWMKERDQEITAAKLRKSKPEESVSLAWQTLETFMTSESDPAASMDPLMKTEWDQDCFYNALCPADASGPCGHVVTGCVATSMAQIMKYWNYPVSGTGSNSYHHPGYGTLSADFGSTTYRWTDMPDRLSNPNDAVATLMFHCGVAVNMQFTPRSSSAPFSTNALLNYFRYSSAAKHVFRRDYTDNEWLELLQSEIDLFRPVWMRGSSPNGGHAFICDGYQSTGHFHFNWGWGGYLDGYFYPGSIEFSSDQAAIVNLYPNDLPDGFKGFFLSAYNFWMGANGETDSVKVMSGVNWSASSDQPWLTLNKVSGTSGTSVITLVAAENNTTTQRTAKITFSAESYNNQIITITQPAVMVVTPGTLDNIPADQLNSIAKLTLAGTIDARDFRTMRDQMPLLTKADLSKLSIAAYTGTEGPYGSSSRTYPAHNIPEGAFYNPETGYPKNSLVSVILPSTTKGIGNYAFYACKGLNALSLPASLTSVGLFAFSFCSGMTSWIIPSAVTSIGPGAFIGNTGKFTVAPENPNYTDVNGVLFNKSKSTLIQCPVSKTGYFEIPASVKSLEDFAFFACEQLTSVAIPASVETIKSHVFYNCKSLTSIHAFSITPVDLASSNNVFFNVDKANCKLFVSAGSVSLYAGASQWKDFLRISAIVPLEVSPAVLILPAAEGSSAQAVITTGGNWTATSGQSWLTPDPPSGSGHTTMLITASANTLPSSRSATITISAEGALSRSILVTQLSATSTSQEITLHNGWNIFSTHLIPDFPLLEALVQPLIQIGKLIKVQDETGLSLEDLGIFGGWTNNIGNISITEGYKIKVNGECRLVISGTPVPLPLSIPLKTGWNIISFPLPTETNGLTVVQQLIDRGALIKVQDESGQSIEDLGFFGGWQNNIGYFKQGEGYKIKVRSDDTLTIP